MNRTFVTLPWFLAQWKHMGLTDDDMRRLEMELLSNPKIGSVMQGTGKVRKMRFAFDHVGKSGSSRVIYVDFDFLSRFSSLTHTRRAKRIIFLREIETI